jgi:hypothetical protein
MDAAGGGRDAGPWRRVPSSTIRDGTTVGRAHRRLIRGGRQPVTVIACSRGRSLIMRRTASAVTSLASGQMADPSDRLLIRVRQATDDRDLAVAGAARAR